MLSGPAAAVSLFPLHSYSTGEGLPSAQVYGLVQDTSGRMWLFTRAGIAAFDGRRFRSASLDEGLPPGPFSALGLDAQLRPVAARLSDRRLYRREGAIWKELAPITAGGAVPISRIVHLSGAPASAELVAGTLSGLWVLENATWRHIGRSSGLPSDDITALARVGDRLAVGTASGLCWLLAGRPPDCSPAQQDSRLAEPVLALAAAPASGREDRLLVLTRRWLGGVESGRLSIRSDRLDAQTLDLHFSPDFPLAALGADRTGAAYFGNPFHLYVLPPQETVPRPIGSEDGLVSRGATAILTDREGGVWIGGLRGLTRIGSRRFLSLDEGAGLAEREVTAIAEPRPGRIVVGHQRALTFIEGSRIARRPLVEVPGVARGRIPRVLDMTVDSVGTTWAAAALALLEIRSDRQVIVHSPSPRVASVEVDPRGRLWIAGADAPWVRRDGRFHRVTLAAPEEPARALRWLATDGKDRLFVTTDRGLGWRDGVGGESLDLGVKWHWARSRDGRGDDVFAVLATGGGPILVGTNGGLYQLVGEALEKTGGGLALDRPVYFLLRDRRGRLWAGTDDGVFVEEARGLRQLSVRHGLAGRETNRGAALVDHRDRLWIGTDQGLSIYEESEDLPPAAPPRVEIEAIETSGERYAAATALSLSSHQRALRFHTTTIAFSTENDVVFRYRLEGFDEAWQGPLPPAPAGIRYTNLPPGRYRFRIAAGWSGRDAWGPESATAEIRIAPPLWRRPWFLALAGLALAFSVASLHSWRTRPLRRQARELAAVNTQLEATLAERQRLIAELEARNAELERFAYTASHDLKAPLVTVRAFVDSIARDAQAGEFARMHADIGRVKSAAGTMAQLLDHVLEVSRAGRVIGRPEPVALGPLVLEAAGGIRGLEGVSLEVADELPVVMGDRVRLLEVFENLLGNALKFTVDAERPLIRVESRPSADEALVVVSDNGVGIEPRFHQRVFDLFEKIDPESTGSGVGLAIVKRIVEVHGGRIWVESSGRPGEGTSMCLSLPLAPAGARAGATPAADGAA